MMITPNIESLLTPVAKGVFESVGTDAYSSLVVHGSGDASAKRILSSVKSADLLTEPIVNADSADAVLAGLWLWADWLDESHTLSQNVHSATGSFWHAIMHRREGDFSNAKYWYARCRNHPALGKLAVEAKQLSAELRADRKVAAVWEGGWNPNALVDLAEAAERGGDPQSVPHQAAVWLQRLEWRVLFEATVVEALGTSSPRL